MEWLDFSSNGMMIMGTVAGLAGIGLMFFLSKSME